MNINDGLPSSIQTEITVLGAMILDGIAQNDALAKLRPEDFSLDSHQRIYRVMVEMTERSHKIDYTTVWAALQAKHEIDSIGGPAYLAYLSEGIPRHPKIEDYVRIIKDKSLSRQVMGVLNDGMVRLSDQSEESLMVLNSIEQDLMELTDAGVEHDLDKVSSVIAGSFGSVDALYEQGREITGLATHYIEFDRMTCGLQNGELIIIAARPSMGKTAWAINIAQNAAVQDGKTVAVFSLEMSKEQLVLRMLAAQANTGSRKIQRGFIPREDKNKLVRAVETLMDMGVYIDDSPNMTVQEMRAKARRLKQKTGKLDLIVVDYLQLMEVPYEGKRRSENRTQEVSSISRGLKALSKELKVPVMALSQLSRASETRGGSKKPMLSDLRESGSIEQDADVVAFIHREEYYDRDNPDVQGKAEIIIAKQRNGPVGSIFLAFLNDTTRFENLANGDY